MGLLITFVLSYVVTMGVYYPWYLKRNNLERKEYVRKLLYASLSISLMITGMYYFVEELEFLFVLFAYIGVVLASDNVMIPAYLNKEVLTTMKIDYFVPGLINTTIIFAAIYFLLF